MKKLTFAFCALAMLTTVACSKKQAPQAPVAAQVESLKQIEVTWQLNDNQAADPKTALHCRYIIIQDNGGVYTKKQADVKTTGECDWSALKSRISDAGTLSADQAAQINNIAVSTPNLGAAAVPAWDCASYSIRTSVRAVGLQDCTLGNRGENVSGAAAAARQITNILGL